MKFIDLEAQRARLSGRIEEAVKRVIEGGQYILGPEVTLFEEKLAEYVGVKHAIACGNGTDALLMPLMAKKIVAGDAVFCPSFTFAATAEVAALAGAVPVFVDIDRYSYNMDPLQLEACIKMIKAQGKLRPRAIIAVDLFGAPANYAQIAEIAAREGLFLIEDAAQAMGGKSAGKKCGAFGDVATTSFYPAKPLGCYGDGGAMFTNDDSLAEVLRSILFHGKNASQYDNVRIGLNSRLDTIQAAILLEKIAILEEEIQARQRIALRYTQALADVVEVPSLLEGEERSAFAQYTIETDRRDELKQHLHDKNVPTMVYYVKPLHLQRAYEDFPRQKGGLPVCEERARRVLSLPMHPYLTEEAQNTIITAIRTFFVH